jgi:hypothetical protein
VAFVAGIVVRRAEEKHALHRGRTCGMIGHRSLVG